MHEREHLGLLNLSVTQMHAWSCSSKHIIHWWTIYMTHTRKQLHSLQLPFSVPITIFVSTLNSFSNQFLVPRKSHENSQIRQCVTTGPSQWEGATPSLTKHPIPPVLGPKPWSPQPLWRNWPAKLSITLKEHKISAIAPFNVIQGHRGWYQSKTRKLVLHPISYLFGVIAA